MTEKYWSMYHTSACPKCGSHYTWAGVVSKPEFDCTDCGYTEPLSADNYQLFEEKTSD